MNKNSTHILDRFKGCLLGLAIGDALGAPLEGRAGFFQLKNFNQMDRFIDAPGRQLKAGQYTDDTKMMLCIAESIVEKKKIDAEDIAYRL